MERLFKISVWGIILFLAGFASLWSGGLANGDQPLATVVYIPKPPVVDGKIGPGEWDKSSSLSGFKRYGTGEPVPSSPRAYLAWDKENLYLAVDIPTKEPPVSKITERDGPIDQDNDVEIFIDPEHTHTNYFQFSGNSIGTVHDGKRIDGVYDSLWNASWDFKADIHQGGWSCEYRIPFTSLGKKVQDGEIWGFNVVIGPSSSGEGATQWSLTHAGYGDPKNFGHLRFETNSPTVQVSCSEKGPILKFINSTSQSHLLKLLSSFRSEGKTIVAEEKEIKLASREEKELPVAPNWGKAGFHSVEITITDRSNRPLYHQIYEIASVSEEAQPSPKPAWSGSKVGRIDKVLKPWTPVEVKGNSISCWGRRYSWGILPFPEEIITQNRSILSGPIRVKVVVNGKEVDWNVSERLEPASLVSSSGVSAQVKRMAQGEGLRLEGRAIVEYDGMVRIDFSISPLSLPIEVESFTVEIPYKKEFASLMHSWPSWSKVGGEVSIHPTYLWFSPMVWLGNEDCGLLWFAESDEGWKPAYPGKAIEITPQDGEVVLRLHIWDKPSLLNRTQKFTMGLQATPVKPWPKDWHQQSIVGNVWWTDIENPKVAYQAWVSYPAKGNINLERGTIEMWVKPLFDVTSKANRERDHNLFSLRFPKGSTFRLDWEATIPGFSIYSDQHKVLSYAPDWESEQWHHLAITWTNKEIILWIDNYPVTREEWKGLGHQADVEGGEILVGGYCDFIVDELRISDIPRSSSDPGQPSRSFYLLEPPAVDNHTLLLDNFDTRFQPDRVKRTKAVKISSECGVSGGLVERGVKFVPGKFGLALQLLSSLNISPGQHLKSLGVKVISMGGEWSKFVDHPTPRDASKFKRVVEELHQHGIKVIPYFGYEISDKAPEWPIYGKECIRLPEQVFSAPHLGDQKAYAVCQRSHWADFMVEGIAKMKEEYGIDGVYLDATGIPLSCVNKLHGCGYVTEAGSRKPTYPLFAVRDTMKRIATIFEEDGIIEHHVCDFFFLPSVGFSTCLLAAERPASFGKRGKPLLEYPFISLEAFRALYMGQKWGVPVRVLSSWTDPYTDVEMLSLSLLHDIPVRPDYAMPFRIEEDLSYWRALENFGADEAEWFPYWKNQKYLSSSHPSDIKVSFYKHKGKGGLLLVISNLGNQDIESAWVGINLSALGNLQLTQASNALTGESVVFKEGRINLSPLPKWNPQLILVK